MRPFILLSTLSVVVAQFPGGSWFGGMSQCSRQCVFSNLSSSGCNLGDFKCVCSNQTVVQNVTSCVSKCNAAEASQMSGTLTSFCGSSSGSSVPPTSVTSAAAVSGPSSAATPPSTLVTSSTSRGEPSTGEPSVAPSGTETLPAGAAQTEGTTQTDSQASTESKTPVGAIVGGVVGGFGGVSLILAMIWLILREKNRGASINTLPRNISSAPPHVNQVEDQEQPIWDGREAYKWNPRIHAEIGELPES
ncbi:hypothetical protein H072_6489 [Dactylellina haptotyla CBS 200.50]|uniref:CFEM domain-containing protein n=1 Tax=Dactylellina haptotyla (strain CBS 200.50) TaxID=1284197 RepID=S8AEZ4_DACHA|nr:hypothetical protein H072_6489 [Dactylellina haptotyla CBS 200.50]